MEKIREITIVTEKNESYRLGYFLECKKDIYGVVSELVHGDLIIGYECVLNLWEERESALECIELLADNSVTPTTLVEILDEIMS